MVSKRMIVILLAIVFLFSGCIPAKSSAPTARDPDYWPNSGWRSSTPEEQGMDSNLLAQMLEGIAANQTRIHSLLVIRNGYSLVDAYNHPYTPDTSVHIQSVTKTVLGMLVGKAIGEGVIKSENEKLVDYYRDRLLRNPSAEKDTIQLKDLLSMASGLDCQEFTSTGPVMEQSSDWVQFMLDLPVKDAPGEVFGYCNGNAQLLSAILQQATGIPAREYANQKLFQPLGISPVAETDWASDPQGVTTAGYGLHLRPADMAKLAFLYLNNGKWEGQQIIPAKWVADSTREQIQKDDGNGYGYLWTVYPQSDHYAALGMGGQQIHVYPAKNLIVVVTASLESYAEATEIEKLLANYILPAIQSDGPLAADAPGYSRLQAAGKALANPIREVASLPASAVDISQSIYRIEENPLGWERLKFVFEPGASTAQLFLNDFAGLEIGLDHIYRLSEGDPFGALWLRGQWTAEDTFVIDYPYPWGGSRLGELGETEFRFTFSADHLQIVLRELVFGGEELVIQGTR